MYLELQYEYSYSTVVRSPLPKRRAKDKWGVRSRGVRTNGGCGPNPCPVVQMRFGLQCAVSQGSYECTRTNVLTLTVL